MRAPRPTMRLTTPAIPARPAGGAAAAGGAPATPLSPRLRSARGSGLADVRQPVPRPVRGPGGGSLRAPRTEVAPSAPGAGARRERLGLGARNSAPESLVSLAALGRDRLGAPHVPVQRCLGVFPGVDLTAGQMMEFHPAARLMEDPGCGERVQRECQ